MAPARLVVLSALLLAACSDGADDEEDIARANDALGKRSVVHIATISYAPNSFVIGNAYPGWTDLVQGPAQYSKGPGNPNGSAYRWGYLFGENFDHCAWIDDGDLAGHEHHVGSPCGPPQEIDTSYFLSKYTSGMHSRLAGDGSLTHMHYAGSGCSDHNGYGNVAPWRVPATPANEVGPIPDGKVLRWRYVSKDGHWVLVRDPEPVPNQPNWYFVHRGCVSVANTH